MDVIAEGLVEIARGGEGPERLAAIATLWEIMATGVKHARPVQRRSPARSRGSFSLRAPIRPRAQLSRNADSRTNRDSKGTRSRKYRLSPEGKARLQACIGQTRPWEHSTGPRTPEGKARSSRNRLTHGRETNERRGYRRAALRWIRMARTEWGLASGHGERKPAFIHLSGTYTPCSAQEST
jgi:hypothetical protein